MNRAILKKSGLLGLGLLTLVAASPAFTQPGPTSEVNYLVNWEERLNPTMSLKPHDENLLGEHINLLTGGLSFEHVDVSIPGNSDLPVEIRRRRNPGQSYNNEFHDWQLAVPTISTKIHSIEIARGIRWGKNRCSKPLLDSIPSSDYPKQLDSSADIARPHEYSDGVLLDVPGRTSSLLLDKIASRSWPAGAQKVTVDDWYLTCIANIDGAGTEGFYAYAPNGERYKFDVIRLRRSVTNNRIWTVEGTPAGTRVRGYTAWVYYDVLAASEVVDVHGNWVRYHYDSEGRLTDITSNDGRHIELLYTSSTSIRISSVVAHPRTVDQRTWTYDYGTDSFRTYGPPREADGIPGIRDGGVYVLKTVTLPNGRQWQFSLGGLAAKPVPGSEYWTYTNREHVECKQLKQVVSLTHPDGIVGEFELEEFRRWYPLAAGHSPNGPPCPNSNMGGHEGPHIVDFMAVVKKTLSASTVPTSVWHYDYSNGDTGEPYGTIITLPDGSVQINHYIPSSILKSIEKEEIFADASAATPLQTTAYTYFLEDAVGTNFIRGAADETRKPFRWQEITVTRGSDEYHTRHTYVTSRHSSNYSYGRPVKTDTWSNLSSSRRFTDYTWRKDQDDWILGLLDTVTRNYKLFDDYDYDHKGRLVTHKRFGHTVATLGYHTSGIQAGKLNWHKDAIGRQTTYSNYYRGAPQNITRADNTVVTRAIDRNGWVTRHTNARGFSTSYAYDPLGRLTLIDRPATWSDTSVAYTYSGDSLAQTATQGSEKTKTTYDAMLRPIQVHREDLLLGRGLLPSSNHHVYTETAYDTLGRVSFASLPSATAGSSIGTETSYDALGRVTQTRETAVGGGTTYYEYLTGNQTQVTDPMGNVTTTTASGYGSPDDGNTINVDQPEGISADYTYDIYGNLLSIAQAKGFGSTHVSSFLYDSRYRLCRRSVPETGDTWYRYNNANEIAAYGEGQPASSHCTAAPVWDIVNLTYDLMGRLKTTNYPDTQSNIERSYDANGNLIAIDFDGVEWDYNYNEIDLIEDETLRIDGRRYAIDYVYNNQGFLTSKTTPSGRQYTFSNDGLGRLLTIDANGTRHARLDSYHPNGKINLMYLGQGGDYYSQSLNPRQLVSAIGGSSVDNRRYSYDANGRVEQISSAVHDVYDRTFTYDGAGRLSTASGPWGTGSYSYDTLGNLTQKMLGSRVVDIEYNDTLNRVSRARDTAAGISWHSYSYDARGNTTSNGVHGFSYNYANQPIQVTGSSNGTYTYDGNLKRVKVDVDGKVIYNVFDASGALVHVDELLGGTKNISVCFTACSNVVVPGPQKTDYIKAGSLTIARLEDNKPTYLHNDHLGSPVAGTDADGNVVWQEHYTPYGEKWLRDAANDDQGSFTGHIADSATGLTYMQARYYDPVIGRFLSPDPVGYQDQLNVYAYVGNDPVNYTDPSGMRRWGVSVGGSFAYKAIGARFKVEMSYDTEYGEVNATAKIGYRAGAKLAAKLEGYVEPSSQKGTNISAKVDDIIEAVAEIKTPIGTAQLNVKATANAELSSDQGLSGERDVDPSGSANWGPTSVDAKTGRTSIGVGGGVGIAAGVDVVLEGNVSFNPDDEKSCSSAHNGSC